jgi:hypothetical protein
MITKLYFYEKDHNELLKEFEETIAHDADHIYDDSNLPGADTRVRPTLKEKMGSSGCSPDWRKVFELQ